MKDQADLILRDFLAVDRTRLANQRTLLSMIRTGLYLIIMGLTVMSLEAMQQLKQYAWFFFAAGFLVVALGVFNFIRNNKRISEMYRTKRA